ncbi:S1/P1 nuclease [Legionella nagasakiensis]|uniref:S1/P1 nuclease n=1 Tax=Legionella nagasakiensis TaxID=535290 RepID=UPI0010561567|nr:S1/P1 nuclease [Legionella nagasakiensis]
MVIMKNSVLVFILSCLLQPQALGWNALGHRLVAQIAYDHLTPHARSTFNHYNHALDKEYPPQSLVNAAVWLDSMRYHDVNWFNSMHYINWYFSEDASPIPLTQMINALWAIREASHVLESSKANEFEKGIGLRILLHVVGDIHQPLHAASRVSKQLPEGDQGGNLVHLGNNPVADNLHAYWDKGGGLLLGKRHYSRHYVIKWTSAIEKQYPCKPASIDIEPNHWAEESHKLAVKYAYTIKNNEIPTVQYQRNAQKIVKQRLALAGCRLAAVLNQIDSNLSKKNSGVS